MQKRTLYSASLLFVVAPFAFGLVRHETHPGAKLVAHLRLAGTPHDFSAGLTLARLQQASDIDPVPHPALQALLRALVELDGEPEVLLRLVGVVVHGGERQLPVRPREQLRVAALQTVDRVSQQRGRLVGVPSDPGDACELDQRVAAIADAARVQAVEADRTGIAEDQLVRRLAVALDMEQHLVADLKAKGYDAVSALAEWGPKAFEKMDEAQVLNQLQHSGADAVMTIKSLFHNPRPPIQFTEDGVSCRRERYTGPH